MIHVSIYIFCWSELYNDPRFNIYSYMLYRRSFNISVCITASHTCSRASVSVFIKQYYVLINYACLNHQIIRFYIIFTHIFPCLSIFIHSFQLVSFLSGSDDRESPDTLRCAAIYQDIPRYEANLLTPSSRERQHSSLWLQVPPKCRSLSTRDLISVFRPNQITLTKISFILIKQ
jgi:hypothetical protein